MAITLTTPNYTQYEKDFFITDAVIDLTTVSAGLMYVATGVKNDQYAIPTLSSTPQLNPYSATPTSYGSTVLGNRTVTLGKFMPYEEFNPNVFENHWHVDQLTDRLMARQLPATFENYLGAYYTKKTFAPIETAIHMGSTGYTTSKGVIGTPGVNWNYQHFDGIIRQAVLDGTSLKVASPVALTSANIISKLEAAKNLLPTALLADPKRYEKVKFIMSVLDIQKYEEALASTTYKNQDTTEAGARKYKGYKIEVVAGLPENTFYFCEATTAPTSNLHMPVTETLGMNFNIDRLQNNSDLYFYKGMIKMGVTVAKMNEFVIYTTKVAADFTA
jgi:hypothetical protein